MNHDVLFRNYLTKKRLISLLTIFSLLTAFFIYKFLFASTRLPPQKEPKLVEVEILKSGNIQQTVRLIGIIHPKHATILLAKSSGMLDSLVATGQKVRKGQLIAKLDNPDIETNLTLSEVAETIAKTQYDRLFSLLKTGIVSAKEVEEKKQAWIQAQRDLSKTKIELDTIRFYAPFDGIIGAYKKREGTQVNQGDPIVTLYDPSSLVVDFDIPCTTLNTIHEGQAVRVLNNDYKLSHVQKMIDDETHMCPADVDIDCESCVIGSNVDVDLVVDEKKEVLVIPSEAIFLRNSKPFVYLVKDNKVSLTPVKTGVREKSRVEIIAGLQPGQQLIIRGQERLYPNMSVKIYQPATLAVNNQTL